MEMVTGPFMAIVVPKEKFTQQTRRIPVSKWTLYPFHFHDRTPSSEWSLGVLGVRESAINNGINTLIIILNDNHENVLTGGGVA